MKFKIRIRRVETYIHDTEVEADSAEAAVKAVEDLYDEGEYDSEFDFWDDVETHINCFGEVTK